MLILQLTLDVDTNLSLYLCLGGARIEDIQTLSKWNISMDIATFMSLDPAVVKVECAFLLFCYPLLFVTFPYDVG